MWVPMKAGCLSHSPPMGAAGDSRTNRRCLNARITVDEVAKTPGGLHVAAVRLDHLSTTLPRQCQSVVTDAVRMCVTAFFHECTGTGTDTSPHDLNAETETETERSLHEELAHGEAQGDLHSKLMLLVAVLVLVLAMAVTPLELVLALGSDILSAVGGVLRGSRYLVGTLSDTIRTLCGWAVLGTSKIVQAIADAVQ